MKGSNFFFGLVAVVLLTFAKSQITSYWVPIEFSFFLIFFVLRSSSTRRALIFTLITSLTLDLIFQTGQIKGLDAMGQLLMVYLVIQSNKLVIPTYSDLFLLGSFAIFFLGNYIIGQWLSSMLGVYAQSVSLGNLFFFALCHTAIFALLLFTTLRFRRDKK